MLSPDLTNENLRIAVCGLSRASDQDNLLLTMTIAKKNEFGKLKESCVEEIGVPAAICRDAGRDVDARVVEGEFLEAGALLEEVKQGERASAAGARQPQPREAAERGEEERKVAEIQAAKKDVWLLVRYLRRNSTNETWQVGSSYSATCKRWACATPGRRPPGA